MNSKYDWEALELEFVTGPEDQSVRSFAAANGIDSWSVVNDQANKREWKRKRAEHHADKRRKSIVAIEDATAEKIAKVKTDALDVIHAAILKMGLDLQDRVVLDYDHSTGKQYQRTIPGQTVTPADLAKLVDKLLVLTGSPSAIQENRNLGLNLNGGDAGSGEVPPTILELLASVAGERGSSSGDVGRATLPGASRARTN
ncbi:MAG TPA: hypothetical protein VFX15_02790 [Actinomycetes bacterium]|nr:hypothetical protein [Actinomycetes bacterium]